MKTIIYCLFFASVTLFAQQNQAEDTATKNSKNLFSADPENKFKNDFKSGKLTLYLMGGIVSVIKKADMEFEKKYQINYHDFGCMPPNNFEFYEQYNQLVFNHLLKQHGREWIHMANINAFGFEKWKKDIDKM